MMHQKSIVVRAFSALILTAGIATGAQAQKIGTYSGTADDGTFISFSVTKPTSNFQFTNGDVNFQAACTNPSRTANEGWGFFLGQDIVAGTNNFHSGNDYYDTRGAMHFVNNNTIKGTITSYTAVFVPGNDPPKKAQFCVSSKQGFTLHFQAAPERKQLPTATVLETRRTQ